MSASRCAAPLAADATSRWAHTCAAHSCTSTGVRPSTPPAGESQTPVDPSTGRLMIRILVDRTSVELFVGDGRVVHSHRVFPLEGDDRIRLYAHEGQATFRGLTIRELSIP